MYINNVQNTSFRGYDAIRLRGLHMQNLATEGKHHILNEMKDIAKKERLELFTYETGSEIAHKANQFSLPRYSSSIWCQDLIAFVRNKFGKRILLTTQENLLSKVNDSCKGDFRISALKYMPRGGDYYIGYKDNGEKWAIINSNALATEETFKVDGDKPTKKHVMELFGVEPENIVLLNYYTNDIDRVIRPVGFPYILVNDSEESLKLLEKMHEKFPENTKLYKKLKKYIETQTAPFGPEDSTSKICEKLEHFGFKPIKIGARFHYDIDYINALSWINNEGNLSYVTNSVEGAGKELEYLEFLFDKSLKEKMPRIKNSYYVNGGEYVTEDNSSVRHSRGLLPRNVVMDILANRNGGIHCMTAEVPELF